MSEWGQDGADAVLAIFDVYCPRQSGVSNNPGGTNNPTNNEHGSNNEPGNQPGNQPANQPANQPDNQAAKNGAEQDRIYKSTKIL